MKWYWWVLIGIVVAAAIWLGFTYVLLKELLGLVQNG